MFKLSSRGLRRIALVLGFLVLTVLSDSGARMNKHAGLVLPQLGNVMALYGGAPVTIYRNAILNCPINLRGKSVREAQARRRLCLAIRQKPACTCKSPNGVPTSGASLTLIPTSDSSRSWPELF